MLIDRPDIESGIKIAAQVTPEPTEDDLAFIQQMGVGYVVLWTDATKSSYEYYASRRQLFEDHGLKVYGFGNSDVHNQDAIVLGLENRDAKIEEYKQHLRHLGQAGIPYTTYAHMANGIWSTEPELTRGGAPARAFNLEKAKAGHWHGRQYPMPFTHGRPYSEEEIWDNFAYFIKQVVPVAEEAGVKIGIHPDDPPVPELGGIPRCIFGNFEGYRRAIEMANSPNVGLCLCVGCWLEGGAWMGKDVFETIQYFGERQKLFKIHFRNVNRPLPYFVETFLDDGYMDMYRVMRALREVNFDGVVIADHIPLMAKDHKVGTAFSIGYMKALVERANAEFAPA
ncbi:MAG TPA: mannonate dehydratase [Anaerolineae bacterium]|nr:mannonate dehydratase [Anaerolineae bacterium]HQH39698.1 mannonate dehydratase [Anaerolineae bacterium]